MVTTAPDFRAEEYRRYLVVLARVHLVKAGPARHKLDASDLVQDVLLQAHVAQRQFRGAGADEFAAWLRQILANKLIDAQRRYGQKKRDAALELNSCRAGLDESASRLDRLPATEQSSPSQRVARHERALLLAEALTALPEEQRAAVELRYLGDQSLDEIAALMDRTKPSVAGLLRRGLGALRQCLERLE